MGIPVAYFDPNIPIEKLSKLKEDYVQPSIVGKEYEKGSVQRKNDYATMLQMSTPVMRMKVQESVIPVKYLYNPQIRKVKEEQAVRNQFNKEFYLPQEPPQSIHLNIKEGFAHFKINKEGYKLIGDD